MGIKFLRHLKNTDFVRPFAESIFMIIILVIFIPKKSLTDTNFQSRKIMFHSKSKQSLPWSIDFISSKYYEISSSRNYNDLWQLTNSLLFKSTSIKQKIWFTLTRSARYLTYWQLHHVKNNKLLWDCTYQGLYCLSSKVRGR